VPVGPAGPLEVTVAISPTDCPNVDGFGLAVNVVVVGYELTTCVSAGEVLVAKVVSPA
jgi:hypothetical protein